MTKFENNEVGNSFNEFMENIDAVVMGKNTFEKVLSFSEWPYSKIVFVLSTALKSLPERLKGKVKILSMKPRELLNYLESEGYSGLYIDGSKVIQSFLKENLIDELIITRVPVLIGHGISLFGSLEIDIQFKHIRTIVYSNGLVKSRYEKVIQ